MTSPPFPIAHEHGFALIGVLWLVVLIAVVGLDFSLRAGVLTRRAINAADLSSARAAAEGGLLHAESRLVEELRRPRMLGIEADLMPDPWHNPATLLSDTLEFGDALVVVGLEDAGSRLHLNRVAELELRRVMTALRIDDADAARAAQAILDWRDLDDARRGRGAERQAYVQAEAPVLPTNGPFGSVGELLHVMGVTPDIFARLEPFLTVKGSGRVNLSSAPVQVIAALPGMSTDLLAIILRARENEGRVPDLLTLTADFDENARERLRADLPALLGRVTTETEEVLIRVHAWRRDSVVRVEATAVAVRSGQGVFIVERSMH